MEVVIDSGAMVDVISKEMFIASGLAQNNDTSMQIGDVNGGMNTGGKGWCPGPVHHEYITRKWTEY